jgi:hypothetical protein
MYRMVKMGLDNKTALMFFRNGLFMPNFDKKNKQEKEIPFLLRKQKLPLR